MGKTYKYTIELDAEEWPRYLADQMTMSGFFARHLVSVTDNQRSDHWYGDNGRTQSATYHVQHEDEHPRIDVFRHLEDEQDNTD